MEWKHDDEEVFDDEESVLEKSKSDSSIASVINSYRSQCIQVPSLVNAAPRECGFVTSLERLNFTSDIGENDDSESILPLAMNDCTLNYNDSQYNLPNYRMKTYDKTAERIVFFKLDILDFQGTRHNPDEIAPFWKKDCRSWLWKSVRLAKKKLDAEITSAITQISF